MESSRPTLARPAPGWAFALVAALALGFLVKVYVQAWSPATGLTEFIMVGRELNARGLPAYRDVPKYMDPHPADRWGFDGQYYAEMALSPLLRDPGLKTALDNPPYRARRILLSWLAWAGGLGRPSWVLNVYAALNPIFWLGYVVILLRLFRPHGWAGLAGFAAMLLTCGVIESMSESLTDFPAWVLLTLGLVIGGAGGAGVTALAGLAREVDVLGLLALLEPPPPWRRALRRNLVLAAIAWGPVLLWLGYVTWRFGLPQSMAGEDNLDWPLRALIWKLGRWWPVAAAGAIHWHRFYRDYNADALLTIVALATQCVYVLTHRDWGNRLWRLAVIFVAYFVCIGRPTWVDHLHVARHALPITLGFNLLLAMGPRRGWLAWFLLGNCFVPYSLHEFWYLGSERLRPAEIRVTEPPGSAESLAAHYGAGWYGVEHNEKEIWRWSARPDADLILTNRGRGPAEVRLSFTAMSYVPRDLRIEARGAAVWSGKIGDEPDPVRTGVFALPPGETAVHFEAAPGPAPHAYDPRPVACMVEDLELEAVSR